MWPYLEGNQVKMRSFWWDLIQSDLIEREDEGAEMQREDSMKTQREGNHVTGLPAAPELEDARIESPPQLSEGALPANITFSDI